MPYFKIDWQISEIVGEYASQLILPLKLTGETTISCRYNVAGWANYGTCKVSGFKRCGTGMKELPKC
jgi:hypothetical protein